MVAKHQPHGDGDGRKNIAQQFIGFRLAVIAEIARHDKKIGVGMFFDNIGHRRAQLLFRIDAVYSDAGRYEMGVGDLDDLHNRSFCTKWLRERISRSLFLVAYFSRALVCSTTCLRPASGVTSPRMTVPMMSRWVRQMRTESPPG